MDQMNCGGVIIMQDPPRVSLQRRQDIRRQYVTSRKNTLFFLLNLERKKTPKKTMKSTIEKLGKLYFNNRYAK